MWIVLSVLWLLGAVLVSSILMLPKDKHTAEISTLEAVTIVILWPGTLIVLALGLNKFVRDEDEVE